MRFSVFITLAALFTPALSAFAEPATNHLNTLKTVGKEGAGNPEAATAWKSLVGLGIDALIPTLTAMDDAKPVPANYLRLAAQAIVESERREKHSLPADRLEAFVKDSSHAPISRRLAYEFLTLADPKAPDRLLPGMLDDPSVAIRRDAIAAALVKATPLIKSDPKKAAIEFERLFHAGRDKDQVESIAKSLKELNVATDINKHFGVVADWMLVGPFTAPPGGGISTPHEPDMKVDLSADYQDKDKNPIKWKAHQSAEPFGSVDLNKAIGKHKDSIAYAFVAIESEKKLPVEIRLGTVNAIKVSLNGQQLFEREEYHHGQHFDQYVAMGKLRKGRNELLVKIRQNNQTDSWAQDWKFQLRLCDATGGALPLKIIDQKESK